MPSGAIEQLRELLTDYFQPLSAYQTHHASDAAKPGPLWLYREKHLLATDFSYKLSQIQIPDNVSEPEYILAKHLKIKLDLDENEQPLRYSMSSMLLSTNDRVQLVNLAINKAAGFYAKYATSLLITLLLRDADSTLNRTYGLALLEDKKLENPKFRTNSNAIIPRLQVFIGSLLHPLMDDNLDPIIGNLGKAFVDLSHCHFYSEVDHHIKLDGLSFSGQDLRYSQFRCLTLNEAKFAFCNLSNTVFEECKGTDIIMRSAFIHDAQFLNCTFSKPKFQWANLRDSIFKDTQLGTDANNKADLENCDFNNSQFDKHCSLQHIVENAGTQWVNASLPNNIRSSPLQIALSTSAAELAAEIKYRSVKKKLFASANEHAESLPYYWTSTKAQLVKPLRKKINHDELSWFIKELFGATSDYLYYQSRFEGVRLERAYRQGRLFSQLTSEIFNPLTHIGLLGCTEILNIEQYENKDWWSLYQKKKVELKEKLLNSNPAPLENVAWHSPEFDPLLQDTLGECILIHGNSNNIIDSILKHGFKRTADEPGARGWGALGRGGPYLTDAIPKAMQYTKCPSCDGEQCHCPDNDLAKPRKLLFCRVLLGRTQLTKNDKEHRYDAHQNVDYDTVYGPTNIEVPESHFSCNEFLPLEPAGKEPFFLHPNVYPEFIVTVRQHQKQLSKDYALGLQKNYHSSIPIAEPFQKKFSKHEKSIKKFSLTKDPLNKIIECIETYYRLLNHQTLPKDKCLYALSILSENCKIALDYYKNIKDLSDLLEELDKKIANEYEKIEGSSLSRNTQSTAVENIRHEIVGHHYLCSALRTMKTDFSIAKANADAKGSAREAIMAFSNLLSKQGPEIPKPAIAHLRLERAMAYTLIDNHRAAIEDILLIHASSPRNENIKSNWNYCINLSPKLTLEMLIYILGQHSNGQKEVNEAYYAALAQAISRAFGDSNKFKSGEAAVTFILACYQKLTRVEKVNCIDALTKYPHLNPNDNALLPLIDRLRHAQEPDGWYYQLGVEAKDWEAKLSQSFFIAEAKDSSSTSRQIKIFKDQYKNEGAHFYFPTPEIEAQILKLFNIIDGTLKVKNPSEPGNHITLKVVDSLNKPLFWLKIAPEQAATEFSVNLLDRLATGHAQTPMTSMMLIQHVDNPSQAIAVQISSQAPGEVFSKTINKQEVISHPENLAKLSLSSFLRNLLRVLLINPEDDKGDDYFLYQTEDGYELFRIDNERAFYKPIIGNPRDILQLRLTSAQVMQVKSILYCLEQMNSRLDQDAEARSVLEQFAALDCRRVLETWLNKLEQWHEKYGPLFRDVMADHWKKFPDSILALTNPTESEFIQLVNQFQSLQEIIFDKLNANSTIRGLDLLAVINKDLVKPDLPNNYLTAFNNNSVGENAPQQQAARVAERFDQVTKGLYAFNPKTGRRYSTAPPKELDFKEVERISRSAKSPIVSKAREILIKLTDEKLSTIAKGILQQAEDKKELYNKQDDSTKREIFRKIFAAIKDDKKHAIDGKAKKFILEILIGSPLYDVPLNLFSDCKIDKKFINRLVENGAHILKLNLDDCQFLTLDMLGIISKGCININTLSCRRSNLTLLRGTFPTLETLHIDNCALITDIELKAQKLKVLNAESCKNLTKIRTGSYQLERVNLIECSELNAHSIAPLTLLPGHLRAITLAGTKISASHRALAEAYPFLVMLPLENASEIFVEKIKGEVNRALCQYAITPANINVTSAQKIADALGDYLQECQGIFAYVIEKYKNVFGKLWLPALDFLEQKAVVDYYLDKSDEMITLLLSLLSDTNLVDIKIYVISALAQIGTNPKISESQREAVIAPLYELMKERDQTLKIIVCDSLVRIGANSTLSKPQLQELLNLLLDLIKYPMISGSFAINTLGEIGRNSTLIKPQLQVLIAALHNLLEHSDDEVRYAADRALGKISASPTLSDPQFQALIDLHFEWLKDGKLQVRSHAQKALSHISSNPTLTQPQLQELLERVYKCLQNSQSYVRCSAAEILGEIGSNPTLTQPPIQGLLDRICKCLKDCDMRSGAAKALGKIGTTPILTPSQLQTVIDSLCQLLNDSAIGGYAAVALGQISVNPILTQSQLDTVIDCLCKSQEDYHMRISAAEALGKISKTPILTQSQIDTVIDCLCKLLKDSDRDVQISAADALGKMGKNPTLTQPQFEKVIFYLCKLLQDSDHDVLISVANALGKMGKNPILSKTELQAVIDPLCELLQDSDRDVQISAAEALGNMGQNPTLTQSQLQEVIDPLCIWLKDSENSELRMMVALALGRIASNPTLAQRQLQALLDLLCTLLNVYSAKPNFIQRFLPKNIDYRADRHRENDNIDILSCVADALTMIAKKQKLPQKIIDTILPLSPPILSALYSEDYIHNVIDESLRYSGLIPKAKMNQDKPEATSTPDYSPRLFSAPKVQHRATSNAATSATNSQVETTEDNERFFDLT